MMSDASEWLVQAIAKCADRFDPDCSESVSRLLYGEDRHVDVVTALDFFETSVAFCRDIGGEFLLVMSLPLGLSHGIDTRGDTWSTVQECDVSVGDPEVFVLSSRSAMIPPHDFHDYRHPVQLPSGLVSDARVHVVSYYRCYAMGMFDGDSSEFFRFLNVEARFYG
jgi:hypothetical protein